MNEPKAASSGETKGLTGRTGHILLQGCAVGFALLFGTILGMHLIVSGNGVAFKAMHEPLELLIAERADADAVSIGEVRLVRDQGGGDPLKISISEFMIDQGDGRIVDLPKISMRMDGASF
ncbi:MAG: hypothetical protein AAGA69_06305, partial [Pseudomonadota bacterium]